MSRLPCPEDHEMAGNDLNSMSSFEGLLIYLGRFVNEMSGRGGAKTAVEKAFLESGRRLFQELADQCGEMAKENAPPVAESMRYAGMVRPELLAAVNEDAYSLESAGGSSLAKKKESSKRPSKKKSPKRKSRTKKATKRKKA